MYELEKKIGNLFSSKFVGTGPSSYEKRIYQAAVSRRLRNTAVHVSNKWLFIIRSLFLYTQHTVFYHAFIGGVQPLTTMYASCWSLSRIRVFISGVCCRMLTTYQPKYISLMQCVCAWLWMCWLEYLSVRDRVTDADR
jgi:hypothetical protein